MIDPSLLLEREEFELNTDSILNTIKGKTVLVTGAGGSIGSEICRQIALLEPKRLVLFGRGENSIYQIERELVSKMTPWRCSCGCHNGNVKHMGPCSCNRLNSSNIEIIGLIGDIQNKARVEAIFSKYHPEIIYHAAASKHVPLMEKNPTEAILNNVIGTKNLADVSDKYGVETFVMISSDKAVKPSSVMGASKRIAELLIQSMNKDSDTCFSIVRFGNVLGSSGSVVPLFQEQIDKGGPITLTHRDMTRFFMTIPEASKLVIQAGAFATGGEIFILDMGQPVKIVDLAAKMISLNGKSLEEIEIVEVGIRPGEKLHEELMSKNETASDQVLPKTFVSTSIPRSKEEVLSIITSLFGLDGLDLKRAIVYEANSNG